MKLLQVGSIFQHSSDFRVLGEGAPPVSSLPPVNWCPVVPRRGCSFRDQRIRDGDANCPAFVLVGLNSGFALSGRGIWRERSGSARRLCSESCRHGRLWLGRSKIAPIRRDLVPFLHHAINPALKTNCNPLIEDPTIAEVAQSIRSEEHTSELQSRQYLV